MNKMKSTLYPIMRSALCLLTGLLMNATACKSEKPSESTGASVGKETSKEAIAQRNKPEQKNIPPQPAPPVQIAASHILIAYKGAMRVRPEVTRTQEEAKVLAQKVADEAKAKPEKFGDLAKKYSNDFSTGARGGDLGSWYKGQMVPAFDQAAETLSIGTISAPVETPFGFHVIRRNALPPMFSGSHILIAYKGAARAAPTVSRNKAEALAMAKKLAKEAKANPQSFADIAKKNSDCPSAPQGGRLGSWPKGRMVPPFDEAIEKMNVDEISEPVETPFGYHVIRRDRSPSAG